MQPKHTAAALISALGIPRALFYCLLSRENKTMNSLKIYEDIERNIYAALYCIERSSSNSKTGDMVQLAILPIDNKPTKALKDRQLPNCLDCALIPTCYVNTVSLNEVYKKTVDQAVSAVPKQLRAPVRLGSWGDPGLLPLSLLQQLIRAAGSHTGYTHLWQDIAPSYSQVLMASIDHLTAKKQGLEVDELKRLAWNNGYRTYTITQPGEQESAQERSCLYITNNTQCRYCKLCNGAGSKRSIAAPLHGPNNKQIAYKKAAA